MCFWNGQLLRPGSSRQLFESWIIIIIIFWLLVLFFCLILLNEMKKVKVWSRGSLLRLFSQRFILPVRIIFHVDIYIPKHARTHSHTKPYTPVWRPKKNIKYQRILNIERLLKRLFSSFFLSSRQVRWHSLPQTITSFSTHLSLHHAVLAQCFICLRYLQFWD